MCSIFSGHIWLTSRSLVLQIPYDVTRKEIVQLLDRRSDIIEDHSLSCAVHIIMERSTSKTLDCFVEFSADSSIHDQIRRHEDLVLSGRHPGLGSRPVQVEESDQNALLAEIFPRAKSIVWESGAPVVLTNSDPYSTGFKGFFTKEEMVGLVRHAECPQRAGIPHDGMLS
jgi:RNA recognition motif-containing protein